MEAVKAEKAAKPSEKKRKKGLTKKLVFSMLLVGALPLLIGLLLAFFQGTEEIREMSGTSFEALATETARKLDLVVADEISRTALVTIDADVGVGKPPRPPQRNGSGCAHAPVAPGEASLEEQGTGDRVRNY